jgi:hypothetical protein
MSFIVQMADKNNTPTGTSQKQNKVCITSFNPGEKISDRPPHGKRGYKAKVSGSF